MMCRTANIDAEDAMILLQHANQGPDGVFGKDSGYQAKSYSWNDFAHLGDGSRPSEKPA